MPLTKVRKSKATFKLQAEINDEYSEDDDVPIDEVHGLLDEDIESDDHSSPMTFEEMEALYKPKTSVGDTLAKEIVKPALQVTPKQKYETIRTSPPDDTELEQEEIDEEYDEEDEELISDEEEEYSDRESSDVDDTDLLKRLEEKYGKLPHTAASDDEDDEDIDPTWTSKFKC